MKCLSICIKVNLLIFFIPLFCFSQVENVAKEFQSEFGSFASKLNGKWGLKSENSGNKWLIEPTYDTLLLVNCFVYPLASEREFTNIEKVDQLYLFFNDPIKAENYTKHSPFFIQVENVSFDVYKLNGQKCFTESFDFFENQGRLFLSSNDIESQIKFIQLRQGSNAFALDVNFELNDVQMTDFEYFDDTPFFITKQKNGEFQLRSVDLQTELTARKIEKLIHPEKWDSITKVHGEIWSELTYEIPYIKITNSNGSFSLYSVLKQKRITPILPNTAKVTVLASDVDFLYVEYTNGNEKGFYHSKMTEGTPCIFEWYKLNEEDDIEFEAKETSQLRAGLYKTEPYFQLITYFDELIYNTQKSYYAFPEFAKQNSKYKLVYGVDSKNTHLYDTLIPSKSLENYYDFMENGKYGATNGDIVIPAIFDAAIQFEFAFLDANLKSGNAKKVYTSQAVLEQNKLVYYSSSGDKFYQKQGDFRVHEFAPKSFGMVEYFSPNSSEFIPCSKERYSSINPNHYDQIYIAEKGNKLGLINYRGFALTNFDCTNITLLTDSIYKANEGYYGSFFLLEKGKEKAIYSTAFGKLMVDFGIQDIQAVWLSSELYFQTIRHTKKQTYYGLISSKGELIYPTLYESPFTENSLYFLQNQHQFYYKNQVFVSTKSENVFKLDTFYLFDSNPFKYNCFTDKLECYDLKSNRLMYAIDYLQFCRFQGFNLEKIGANYLLTDKLLSDDKQSFFIDDFEIFWHKDRFVLFGKKEKSTFIYDFEGLDFEDLVSKTLVTFEFRKKSRK